MNRNNIGAITIKRYNLIEEIASYAKWSGLELQNCRN